MSKRLEEKLRKIEYSLECNACLTETIHRIALDCDKDNSYCLKCSVCNSNNYYILKEKLNKALELNQGDDKNGK